MGGAGDYGECNFEFVFYFDGAAADFYRCYAVVGLQDCDFALGAEFIVLGADVQREGDRLFYAVEIQVAGEGEFPASWWR